MSTAEEQRRGLACGYLSAAADDLKRELATTQEGPRGDRLVPALARTLLALVDVVLARERAGY
jgi:hypothetical protein